MPDENNFKNGVRVILKVKEWMNLHSYSAIESFERLLRTTDRLSERNLRRYDFHKAIAANNINLISPEIDFLFDCLTGHKNINSTILNSN